MAAGNKTVDVTVRYTPDTSALKSALKGTQNIDFKIGDGNLKKDLLAPVQNAMREVNKALNSGADSKTLLRLFQDVGKEAENAKTKASGMLREMNSVYNSGGNQQMLADLKKYEKELEKAEKKIADWDKNFGNAKMSKMKSDLGVSGVQDARKQAQELENQLKVSKQLTAEEQTRLDTLKEYINTWNDRQKAEPKGDLEKNASIIRGKIAELSGQVTTPQQSVETNKILNQVITELGQAAGLSAKEISKLTSAINTEEKAAQDAANENKKEALKLADVVTGTFLGTSISTMFEDALRKGVQFFKEYDATLTRTMMVTGMTREEVNGLTSSYNKLAKQLSSTTKDVAAAQLVFYQQGLGTKEALQMTQASIAVSKTGGIEAAEAANRLTAAVRGYQLAASDAMTIADKMSALDAHAASSVDELTIAMQKSASQARMAGLDLDYYMAYLSTMQEVTREAPENIGTAMKSITSRLQEIRDIGKIEEDGTTFSNVAKALTSVGIAATDSSGQLRNLQEIMNELGPMWQTLDRNHKAYIATTLAGNRQQSRFIALMDNYDRAMELVAVSQNASGESAKQLRAYNQGLEASFTRLSNAWQQFATKIADSDMIKGVIDLLTKFVNILNKIPEPITKTLVPLIALNKGFQIFRNASSLFGEFKKGLGEKLHIDSWTKDTEKFNKTLLSSETFLGRWANRAKDAFDGLGNRSQEIKKMTTAIQENTLSGEANTTMLQANDATLAGEVTASTGVNTAKTYEKQATDSLTAALEAQKREMLSNDDAYYLESQQAYQDAEAKIAEAKREYANASNELEILKQKRDDSKADLYNKQLNASKGYKDAVNPDKLRQEAISNLKDSGAIDKSNVQLDIFGETEASLEKQIAAEMKRLKKAYGDGYHEIVEDLKKEGLKAKKELDKQISDAESLLASSEGKISSAEENLGNVRVDLLKNRNQNGQSPIGNLPSNQQTPFNFANIKDLWSNDTIGNIDKLKGSFGELGKVINMSSISSGIMIGSLVNMGASALGLDDDLSGALGTFAGLGKTLSGFGPWGWAAAAGIAALQFGFKKLYPSVEDVQKKLDELAKERDEITQSISDINTAKSTYEELRKNLNKTEEEQEKFNNAIEVLQKEVPGAVAGYDSMGNAIINLTKVTEELNRQQEELMANSKKTIKEFKELQKAEGSNGWTIAGDVYSVLDYIANPIGKIAEDIIGQPITLSGFIQDEFIEPYELEAKKRVWQENFTEIFSSLQSIVAGVVEQGTDKNKEMRQKISDSIINMFAVEGMEKGLDTTEVQKQVEELFKKFHYGDLDTLVNVSIQIKSNAEITDKSWAETKEMVTKQLQMRFKSLDLNDKEFQTLLKATLKMSFAGHVDVDSVIEQIDAEVKRRIKDVDFNVKAQKFKFVIQNIDASVLDAMDDMDLLNTTFIDLISQYDNLEDIEQLFRDTDGSINKEKASVILLNKAYGELNSKKREVDLTNLENEKKSLEFNRSIYQGIVDKAKADGAASVDNSLYMSAVKSVSEYDNKIKEVNEKIKKGKEELKDYQNVVNQLVANFQTIEAPSFKELAEDIRNIASELKSIQDLAKDLDEQGGKMSLDNIADMFDILSSYEDSAMTNAQTWELWNSSIEKINNGLSVQNGELIAQASVMEGLNDLSQVSAKIKMAEIEATIEQQQMELELQNAALRTEAAAIEAALEKLRAGKSTAEAKSAIDNEMAKMDANLNAVEVENEKTKFNKILSYTSQFAKQYSKIIAAAKTGKYTGEYDELQGSFDDILNSFKKDVSNEIKDDIIDGDTKASIENLEKRLKQVNGQISINEKTINNTLELKKKISKYLASDNTNLAAQVDKTTEKQKEYNEKLERTLTLLEKIQGLQHSIDENETFMDLYKGYSGEDYGRLLATNLNLAQQQYDVYKDLFDMQQEMTNQAAGDLLDSPYGDMFKIDQNGDIGWASDKMYEKYKGLPEDMQEDIDNLVEAYQKQRDELRDTEKDLAGYAQAVKKAREEMVEMEISIENWLVEALKNREKIMNDARQKALDDEIKMIETAVDARKKANEKEAKNKDLYNAQEKLRRATLDSSGKNNASLLQLQQELEDKQLEISEKRFEDDMDDRKQWLQDTKDAEQETYEYRLETMTWYWEQVQEIQEQGTEAMMQTLIHWNEEYRQKSELQQSEMEREWRETMDAMKTASDMGVELGKLTSDIVDVTHEVESMNISIDKLPGTWEKATTAANNYANAAKKASSYRYSGTDPEVDNGNNDDGGGNKTKIPNDPPASKFSVTDRVKSDAGAIIPYEQQKDGSFKQKSFLSAMNVYDVTVDEVKYSNGSYYYKVRDGKKTAWFNGYQLRKYKKGGMVDYTGPAWVDGTTSRPEAFLSAYQTEQIGALAGALDNNTVNNVSGDSNVTFGSINFNVASMSSAADGKAALETFVKGANDMMAKKGINTTLNINVK